MIGNQKLTFLNLEPTGALQGTRRAVGILRSVATATRRPNRDEPGPGPRPRALWESSVLRSRPIVHLSVQISHRFTATVRVYLGKCDRHTESITTRRACCCNQECIDYTRLHLLHWHLLALASIRVRIHVFSRHEVRPAGHAPSGTLGVPGPLSRQSKPHGQPSPAPQPMLGYP
jgi:hypothetical protein